MNLNERIPSSFLLFLKTILVNQDPLCICYILELEDNFLLKMDCGEYITLIH